MQIDNAMSLEVTPIAIVREASLDEMLKRVQHDSVY
ncbi:hypothetical protein MED217_13074 [Leeuwenhoekiella blandensis MED217]|uniref:Uncharacterized protein n=1 Tax=Leeuwenhoekiella blandensis (strain CECT 7118 / CCUG 51940 / KCTC 22103 / MED217) TaxID=398720 RepID=A3XPT1_LEEBM|nr:hypothetical protein MED217_13074 [Leeuwenhoekiella blandensis MED217]